MIFIKYLVMLRMLREVPTYESTFLNYFLRFCLIVGLYSLRRTFLYVFIQIFNLFRRAPNLKKYGENAWAIVTGASDGIGQGFC